MKFGSIQITKKVKAGDCDQCEKALELGKPYVTITIRATSKAGKHWFHNWRLHLACIGVWLLAQMVARQDRRKKAGRPKNTGLKLSDDNKKRRLALLKQRIRLFREIALQDYHAKELEGLYQRFNAIEQEILKLGGPAKVNVRTTVILTDIEKRLQYGKALNEQAGLDFSKASSS